MDSARATKVAVIGQGYVGLPLAVRAAEQGYDVVGYDLDRGGSPRWRRAARSSRTSPTSASGPSSTAGGSTRAPTATTSPASTSP
ncbi:MAG: hypothetical protein R2711_05010 [Acidimicrobiales bacterium]